MTKSELRVDLLGASFSIALEEDELYVQTVYGRYRTLIENVTKSTAVKDPLKIAILAGLQLCDEVLKLRTNQKTSRGALESLETERNILDLIQKLDNVLGESLPPGNIPRANALPARPLPQGIPAEYNNERV